ncbi:hypothetical protein SAMN05414139_00006 [Burkholderia sp. D7]|nr:hypothetical protein SAMN05414139_00006 [Burkholderia sp. D7]
MSVDGRTETNNQRRATPAVDRHRTTVADPHLPFDSTDRYDSFQVGTVIPAAVSVRTFSAYAAVVRTNISSTRIKYK